MHIIELVAAMAEEFGVDTEDVTGDRRLRRLVMIRHLSMHLARATLGCSLGEIAEAFGRNHAAVAHALARAEDLLQEQPELAGRLQQALDRTARRSPTSPLTLHHDLASQTAFFDRFKTSTTLDLLYNTGAHVLTVHGDSIRRAIEEVGCRVRVVLTSPTTLASAAYGERTSLCPTNGHKLVQDAAAALATLQELRGSLSTQRPAEEHLIVRLREQSPTCSLAIVNDERLLLTPYAPEMDALDVPALEIERTGETDGFLRYRRMFERVWSNAVTAPAALSPTRPTDSAAFAEHDRTIEFA